MKAPFAIFFLGSVMTAFGLTDKDLTHIGFDQNIGREVSRELQFQTSEGQATTLGQCLDGEKPVILVMGYSRCPMLCEFVNDGLIKALQDVRLTPGRDFKILNVSVDPAEAPAAAARRKAEYVRQYGRATAAEAWQFLVGKEPAIRELANEVGFHYAYDAGSGEYAHPSGIVVLTPQGVVSRYLLGVNYDPAELLQAIRGAGREERGSIVHELALLCFHYNPVTGKYSLAILKVVRLAGLLTLAAIAIAVVYLSRRRGALST